MVEVFALLIVAVVLGAIAGTTAGITHYAVITKAITTGKADFSKVVEEAKSDYAKAVAELNALKTKL